MISSKYLDSLQIKAERLFGKPTRDKPTLELLYKFYHFYWQEEDKNNIESILVCGNRRHHVLKLAKLHHDLDFKEFNNKFHTWNAINKP